MSNEKYVDVVNQVQSLLNTEFETDNSGQIIFYSGIFLHSDGSLHNEPEPAGTHSTDTTS
jgi:hypothetical protein